VFLCISAGHPPSPIKIRIPKISPHLPKQSSEEDTSNILKLEYTKTKLASFIKLFLTKTVSLPKLGYEQHKYSRYPFCLNHAVNLNNY